MENVELAPFRSLDDFIKETARFQVPNLKDPRRVVNRIVNNLLYYQTNYFLLILIIFALVGIMHPGEMVFGIVAVSVAFGIFVYVSNNQSQIRRFKRQFPGVSIFVVLLLGYMFIYLFGSVITFLFGIALPMLVVIIHAALRMRNLKNKVANKIEFVGLKRTPMGLFLEALGMEQEAGS